MKGILSGCLVGSRTARNCDHHSANKTLAGLRSAVVSVYLARLGRPNSTPTLPLTLPLSLTPTFRGARVCRWRFSKTNGLDQSDQGPARK